MFLSADVDLCSDKIAAIWCILDFYMGFQSNATMIQCSFTFMVISHSLMWNVWYFILCTTTTIKFENWLDSSNDHANSCSAKNRPSLYFRLLLVENSTKCDCGCIESHVHYKKVFSLQMFAKRLHRLHSLFQSSGPRNTPATPNSKSTDSRWLQISTNL